MSFDIRKFLTENKLTKASRNLLKESQHPQEIETEGGLLGLFIGEVNGTPIYSVEDSSIRDTMVYVVGEEIVAIEVDGEMVPGAIIYAEYGQTEEVSEFLAQDIADELGVKYQSYPYGDINPSGDGIDQNLMENKKSKKQNNMSFDIRKFLTENKLTKASRVLKENISVNGKQVDRGSVQVDGVDPSDYPDFSDAYITYAEFVDGTALNDEELDQMSSHAHEFAAESLQENNPVETLDSQPADVDPTDGGGVNTSFDPSKYESVEQLMREIEVTANRASLQEKMKRVKEAYESLDQKATALEEGEDSKYMSSTKLKEMKKNAKTLRKMYEKYEKEYDKRFNEEMKPKKKKMNEQSSVAEQIRLKKKVN